MFVDETSHTMLAIRSDPTLDSSIGNGEFGSFCGIPRFKRQPRVELWTRFILSRQFSMTGTVTSEHLANVFAANQQLGALLLS